MFKTDVVFTGFYGYKNTGDDAFVEVAAWGAAKIWKRNNVRFLAKKNNLPNTIVPSRAYPFKIPKSYTFQLDYLLKNTDYLISAGGSTIHSEMSESNAKSKALGLKLAGQNIKIGGIGVSIGPFKSIRDERAVQEYLKRIDFLALRDRASYDYASSLNLPYQPINSFDLAALLPDIYNFDRFNKQIEDQKTVGISVCPYESLHENQESAKEDVRNTMIIDLIKQLDREDKIHFKFYVINGNSKIGDYELTRYTIERAKPRSYEILNYTRDTKLVWEDISKCDFMIATRLHAAIFACFSETPFMLNEYHRKCSDFLQDVGYHEEYRLFNSEYNVPEKARQILDILNGSSGYRQPTSVFEMRKLAKLNFTAISL